MGDHFHWQIEEEAEEPAARAKNRGRRHTGGLFAAAAVLILAGLLGGWLLARERRQEGNQQLLQSIQSLLDQERQALLAGDGELYFSLQDNDPAWFAAQLLPLNQDAVRAGFEATNADENGTRVWVNARWNEQDERLQRVLFFERRAGQLRHVANDPAYWGAELVREDAWGRLNYLAVDDLWAGSIAAFIDSKIADSCLPECRADRLPLTVNVQDHFQRTAAPNQINIPSPRLLGLNDEGTPSTRFWQELERRIDAYLTPAAIRFAVPPPRLRDGATILPYLKLAERFNALNPDITVEIIPLDFYPDDLPAIAREFDGAAILPTEAMLASGLVQDLTDFIGSDPEFDAGDYYEQIWQGAFWRDRPWFLPEAAEMQVLYYDKLAYNQAAYDQPSSRWTWAEMAQDVQGIVSDQPQPTRLQWGFLDVGLNALFSYAYNWNNHCSESATIFCHTPLRTENIAAALEWYEAMAGAAQQMPNLMGDLSDTLSATQLASFEAAGPQYGEEKQALILLNFQGAPRKAAIWVDSPVNYEFNFLMAPVGIVPFPGSDRFDGITPLWLSGSFISQYSERPLAVWQWLKFLSYQAPAPRFVPARPSVAAEMGYWTNLPQPLEDVMRTAFPFARPVTIDEKERLTWAQVSAVVNNEMTPQEAARLAPDIQWFVE